MPKEQEPALVSESEYDGMSLGEAISISINDIRAGLLNVEKALLDLVDEDEITIERFTPCYELSNELIVLSKELMMIMAALQQMVPRCPAKKLSGAEVRLKTKGGMYKPSE